MGIRVISQFPHPVAARCWRQHISWGAAPALQPLAPSWLPLIAHKQISLLFFCCALHPAGARCHALDLLGTPAYRDWLGWALLWNRLLLLTHRTVPLPCGGIVVLPLLLTSAVGCSPTLSCCCRAAGSYLSAALVSIVQAITTSNGGGGWVASNVNEAHLDYFFCKQGRKTAACRPWKRSVVFSAAVTECPADWLVDWLVLHAGMLAVLQAITLLIYVFIASRFQYKNVGHAAAATVAAAPHPHSACLPACQALLLQQSML
jgi:hypothetical protein